MLIPLGIISPAAGSVQSGNIDVSIPESGLFLATTVDDSQTPRVGYAVLDPSANAVEGMSIYEFQERGVLVSETSAPLVRLLTSGLVYAEIGNEVSTGLALVNPGDTDSLIEWTTSSGESGNFILAPGEHLSRFLSQEPFELTAPRSAFRFKASAPVGAIAIRVTINDRSEPLMAAIPVAAPWESDALPRTIPHIRSGGGWLSEIILLNPTDRVMEGQVMLRRADRLRAAIEETYVLAAGSVLQIGVPDGSEYSITARYAQITPKAGSLVPSTFAIMSLENGPSYDPERITVTSTSVTADYAGRDFRTFFESREGSRSPGSVNTGVALANPSDKTVTVTVEVLTKNGTYSGVSTTFDLIPDDQKVFFFNLEDRIPGHFVGALRVSSDSDFAVTALRARINERRETLWTRIPMVERVSPLRKLFGSRGQSPEMPSTFPQLVAGGGYQMRLVLMSDDARAVSTTLRTFEPSGGPIDLPVERPSPSEPSFRVFASDAVGDTLPSAGYPAPDFTTFTAEVRDGFITFMVRYTKSDLNSWAGYVTDIDIDVDQNPSTGFAKVTSGNIVDPSFPGTDFYIEQIGGTVVLFTHLNQFNSLAGVGLTYANIHPDGFDATFALSLFGAEEDGRMNFKLRSRTYGPTGALGEYLDYLPDIGELPIQMN